MIQDFIATKDIEVKYLPTEHMMVDVLNKAMTPIEFQRKRGYVLGELYISSILDIGNCETCH